MATPASSTTPPNLRWFAWALILMATIFTLAAAGRSVLIARTPTQAVASLTHVPLPVVAHDLTARDLTVTCLQAGPSPTWSKFQ